MNPKLAKLLKIIDACFIVWPIIKQAIIHLYKFVMDTFDEIVEKWSEALR